MCFVIIIPSLSSPNWFTQHVPHKTRDEKRYFKDKLEKASTATEWVEFNAPPDIIQVISEEEKREQ